MRVYKQDVTEHIYNDFSEEWFDVYADDDCTRRQTGNAGWFGFEPV